jgi:lysophospholipase L1-like esterase
MRTPQRLSALHFLLLVLACTTCLVPFTAFAEDHVDFSRLVVVGDSLSAGFQSNSLIDSGQVHGYANVVAQQAHAPLVLPLIAPPGIPNVLQLQSFGPPPVIVTAPGISTGRENPAVQVTDLAVPGAKIADLLNDRPATSGNVLNKLILGLPGLLQGINRSQVEWAQALHPSVVILWAGNNDVLGAALAGDPTRVTPVAQFDASFNAVGDALAATGAKLVVVNVPDVTLVAALTPAEAVAQQVGFPLAVIGPILGIGPGDLVTPSAAPLIPAILANPKLGPLPGSVVLTTAERASVRATVDAYNTFIAAKARALGAALVDIHSLLDRISVRGVEVRGERLTTSFLGGLFSLDGVHLTNTGYAVVANEVIRTIDRAFDADVNEASVEKIAREDPLVPPRARVHGSALEHIDREAFERLRSVIEH